MTDFKEIKKIAANFLKDYQNNNGKKNLKKNKDDFNIFFKNFLDFFRKKLTSK